MAPSTKGLPGYCTEGFEETVGTNHLGHFLLANLLIKVSVVDRGSEASRKMWRFCHPRFIRWQKV